LEQLQQLPVTAARQLVLVVLCQQLHVRQILDDVHLGLGLLSHAQRVEHVRDNHAERLVLGADRLRDVVLENLDSVEHIVAVLLLAALPLERRLVEVWLLVLAHGSRQLCVTSDGDFCKGLENLVVFSNGQVQNDLPCGWVRAWAEVVALPLKGCANMSTTVCCCACCCCEGSATWLAF